MLSTNDFLWDKTTRTLSQDMSVIKSNPTFINGRDPLKGFMVRSNDTDRIILFKFQDIIDSDLAIWVFRPDNNAKVTLHLINR